MVINETGDSWDNLAIVMNAEGGNIATGVRTVIHAAGYYAFRIIHWYYKHLKVLNYSCIVGGIAFVTVPPIDLKLHLASVDKLD